MKKAENVHNTKADYGHALLCNRGGWTLREMLGADYEKFAGSGVTPFTQKDFQRSLEKVSQRIHPSSTGSKKK